jgi:hypothetical protein
MLKTSGKNNLVTETDEEINLCSRLLLLLLLLLLLYACQRLFSVGKWSNKLTEMNWSQ